MKCTAYAGSLSRGLICDREIKHPGLHRDNAVNAYWTHGAPASGNYRASGHPSDRTGPPGWEWSMIRTCDKCEGGGLIWVPVGEFGTRAATCWKCSGSGTICTQPSDL